MKLKRLGSGALIFVFAAPVLIWLVGPVLWMGLLSLRPVSDIIKGVGTLTSRNFTFENYLVAFAKTDLLIWVRNSVLISFTSTLISCFLGVLAGYAMARFFSRRLLVISVVLLASQIFPQPLLAIPMYRIMVALGLIRMPFLALIVTYISMGLPYAIWMLANYIKQIPVELEEAAIMDGCGRLQAITRVLLPVAAPGVAAAFIFVFITAWGDFLWALVFASKSSNFLLPVGLLQYAGDMPSLEWGTLIAMTVVYALPVIVLFYVLQRKLVSGLSAGAVKS